MKKVNEVTQQEVFDFIKFYLHGKNEGTSAKILAKLLRISQRELRRICSAINSNPEIEGLISTSGKIYFCKTEEECRKAIKTTYRMAFAYLLKARAMEKKCNLQGQAEFAENGTKIKIIYEENDN